MLEGADEWEGAFVVVSPVLATVGFDDGIPVGAFLASFASFVLLAAFILLVSLAFFALLPSKGVSEGAND